MGRTSRKFKQVRLTLSTESSAIPNVVTTVTLSPQARVYTKKLDKKVNKNLDKKVEKISTKKSTKHSTKTRQKRR